MTSVIQCDEDELRSELGHLLLTYRDQAGNLRDLLEAERRALESPEVDALLSISESKSRCVEEMQVLETQRVDICNRGGVAADDQGMHNLFKFAGDGTRLDALWRETLDITRVCRDLNSINGAISRVRQEHMMAALAALSGHEHQPSLYGPAGREETRYEQRGIGQV